MLGPRKSRRMNKNEETSKKEHEIQRLFLLTLERKVMHAVDKVWTKGEGVRLRKGRLVDDHG